MALWNIFLSKSSSASFVAGCVLSPGGGLRWVASPLRGIIFRRAVRLVDDAETAAGHVAGVALEVVVDENGLQHSSHVCGPTYGRSLPSQAETCWLGELPSWVAKLISVGPRKGREVKTGHDERRRVTESVQPCAKVAPPNATLPEKHYPPCNGHVARKPCSPCCRRFVSMLGARLDAA